MAQTIWEIAHVYWGQAGRRDLAVKWYKIGLARYEEGMLSCPVELKSYIPDIRAAATLAGKPGIAVQYCLKIVQGMVEAPSTEQSG